MAKTSKPTGTNSAPSNKHLATGASHNSCSPIYDIIGPPMVDIDQPLPGDIAYKHGKPKFSSYEKCVDKSKAETPAKKT